MSHRYSIAEARRRRTTTAGQVEGSVEVQLTRRGTPVAAVVELERLRGDRPQFASTYRTFLERYVPDDVGFDGDVCSRSWEMDAGRKVSL